MQHSIFVSQAKDVTLARSFRNERFHRVFHALIAEVAQKRIARAEWKEWEGGSVRSVRWGKQAIHNFVRCAIATDGDELAIPLCPRLSRNFGGGTEGRSFADFAPQSRRKYAV